MSLASIWRRRAEAKRAIAVEVVIVYVPMPEGVTSWNEILDVAGVPRPTHVWTCEESDGEP